MNDCQDIVVREALPDLVHGTLPDGERVRVLTHVRDCDACTGELYLIRTVMAMAVSTTPRVDVSAIVAAVPAYSGAPVRRNFGGTHFGVPHLRLAAALLLGAVGVSALVVEHQRSGGTRAESVASTALSPSGVALVGTADLSDEHLAQLIQSMANIDAAPPAEPEPVTPAAYEADAS